MAGRWDIRLSPDGRLKLRKHFTLWNDRVFLTKHLNEDGDRYLLGFSPRVWPRFTAEIRGQKGEAFYLEAAHELKIRSGGRIVIPQPLRDFAGIERDPQRPVNQALACLRFEVSNYRHERRTKIRYRPFADEP